jgi:hypothetical protein
MKFFSMYTPDPKTAGIPPNQERMAEMGKLIEETTKSGALFLTGGLMPTSKGGARVRFSEGGFTVDGPFTEAKEIVGGFAILEAKSREEAIELTKTFLKVMGTGECALQPLMEYAAGQAAQ